MTDRISEKSRDIYVREFVRRYNLSPRDAETIFEFQLNECLTINRRFFLEMDRRLKRDRNMVGVFILSGLGGFSSRSP